MTALTARDLTVVSSRARVPIVEPVDLDVTAGEIVGIVGESGSGKTTLGLALLGYARRGLTIASGRIEVAGMDVRALSPGALRVLRGGTISYVPQDPSVALNPALTIGRQLRETLVAHGIGTGDAERRERIEATLAGVRLPADDDFLARYPHQLSGGQQQRVVLAIAFICRPKVVVLDEPATGLDVTTQAHVVETIERMARGYETAALYITHDLAVVSSLATRILVMYAGAVVEDGPTEAIFERPGHPYTARLLDAIPTLEGDTTLRGIPGRAPAPGRRPGGCAFAPRCTIATPACTTSKPLPISVSPHHHVRCLRVDELGSARLDSAGPPSTPRVEGEAVLSVDDIRAWYDGVDVLHGVGLHLRRGECVALVGESGSGKTTLARVVAGLHDRYDGRVLVDGQPVKRRARDRPRELRRRVQYVFQNPYSSLNPRATIADSISRPLALSGVSRRAAGERVGEALELVALTKGHAARYPDQLSGGERQRAAIARALIAEPGVLICDEVTSALDVSVQATIVELLSELQARLGLSLLFVTHNLPLVRSLATRAIVLRDGRVVETGDAASLLSHPEAEYTRTLLANTPVLRRAR
ncbi:MAG: ABC transporter ATP-binding protein [Gaiellales bacterium]